MDKSDIYLYNGLPFESKLSTDLYALIKKKTYAIDIAISESTKGSNNNNGHFAIYSSDRKIRLFSFTNCKLICIYDERLKVYDKLLSSSSSSDSNLNSFASRMRQKLVHHFKQRLHHLKDNDKLNSLKYSLKK